MLCFEFLLLPDDFVLTLPETLYRGLTMLFFLVVTEFISISLSESLSSA
jgi:hypothetical protein